MAFLEPKSEIQMPKSSNPEPRTPSPIFAGGYAFVVLIVSMTVMLIALAAALPSVYHENQREKEEELIFRGNEYARAIWLFQRQFQRYPKSLDELIRTNNLRFLRHAYKDPMSTNGKWRFIHVGANGALIDSLTQGPQQQPQFIGASGQTAPQPSPLSGGSNSTGPLTFQQPSNTASQSSSPSGQGQDQQGGQEQQSGQDTQNGKPKVRPGCEGGKSESAFFSDNQVQGALIAGVASCSNKASIRVWNKKTKYEEWEFLGTAFQPSAFAGLPQPQQQPQQPQPGTGSQTAQPGRGIGFGQGGVGAGGPGPTPPTAQQPQQPQPLQQPPDTPLTDQPSPPEPDSPETPDNPPQQ